MKPHLVIIPAFVFIGMLVSVVVWQAGALAHVAQSLSAEQVRNAELQNEVARLKETADYFLQRGVEMQSAGNLTEAKAAFEAVVTRFPASPVLRTAQQRLAIVNAALARAEAQRVAEEHRRQGQR
jgi:outer membrane protein assembly factor BamD (BamD/ComL family)